jgi:hypothetical protein
LSKSERSKEPYVRRVFGFAVSMTFGLELVSILMIIGSLVTFAISSSGILHVLTFDIQFLLLLIASGITFLIIIVFAGVFIRGNDALQEKILTPRIFSLSRVTYEAKALLFLFGMALVFFCTAGVYGYYLLWESAVGPYLGGYLSLTVMFVAIGIFFISFLAQIIIALVGRFASKTEKVGRH